MFNLTDLKSFDLNQLDPTKLDLTRFDLSNVELPKFELPGFDLPTFDAEQLSSFDLPKFDLPVDATRWAEFARDTAYAGVGVVVTTVKKVDEQRRELTDQVGIQVRKLVDAVS